MDDFDPALRKSFAVSDVVPKEIKEKADVKIKKDSILLSGDFVFPTLQGEGPTLGMPCVFCRLHVCNLRCTWCDAFYTWSSDSLEFWTEPKRFSFEDVAKMLQKIWHDNFPSTAQKRVIWTGGEPLIQKNQIDEVMDLTFDWMMEIETNGTLMPTQLQLEIAQFNCSPKLSNSENVHHSMVKPKVLQELNYVNTTFKFVCKDEKDLEEIEEKYVPHISEDKIIIMPEGITEEEITPHARALYEPVMKRGWRMTPRFQAIFAEGARRGV